MDAVQTIQSVWDALPDNEALLDFDTFLIGDGAKSLMGLDKPLFMFNFDEKEDEKIVCENDLSEFDKNPVYIEDVENIFYDIKKEIFERFGYLKRKSEQFSGQLFLEKDLIISQDDQYLMEYLKGHDLNENSLTNAIAQLCAYKELGFLRVKFYSVDDCSICNAFDGNILVVENLISNFCVKNFFSHEFMQCKFVPVIEDRKYFANYLDIDVENVFVGETLVENFPIEYTNELTKILENVKYKKVIFCNFSKFEDVTNEVVIEVKENLYVDNKYLESYSPIDLLKIWLGSEEKIVEKVEGSIEEIYYLNGKRVKKTQQGFVDVESGEIVK